MDRLPGGRNKGPSEQWITEAEKRPVALLKITLPTPCKVPESVEQQGLISKWEKMAFRAISGSVSG